MEGVLISVVYFGIYVSACVVFVSPHRGRASENGVEIKSPMDGGNKLNFRYYVSKGYVLSLYP